MCTETRGIGMGLAVTRLEVSRQSWPAEGKVGAEVLLPTGEESQGGVSGRRAGPPALRSTCLSLSLGVLHPLFPWLRNVVSGTTLPRVSCCYSQEASPSAGAQAVWGLV